MTIMLDYPVSKTGRLVIDVDIRFSAEDAQKIGRKWAGHNLTMMTDADLPTLIFNDHATVWRTPIYFDSTRGRVGKVGEIDIHVTTGDIVQANHSRILACIKELAANLPPFEPLEISEEFLLPKEQRSPTLVLPEDD